MACIKIFKQWSWKKRFKRFPTLFTGERSNGTQDAFSKNLDPFQWLITQGQKLPKKRIIYMVDQIF